MHAGKANSYPLESLDDLESLLFAIAHRKLINAYRTKQRETRHAPQVVEVRRVAGVDLPELSVALVELMDQLLEADYERIILREKMNGSKELAIAEVLRRNSGVPWSKYMVREAWRRLRKRARRRFGWMLDEMDLNPSR
jgi:DNA-directed RNA polymerase specialized sigma24 family protein